MSGHSKWAQIKRKKALVDSKKGQIFSKIAHLIEIAAKDGGDPKSNPALKAAIEKARAANMPAANIERAIKKTAIGGLGRQSPQETIYEAYGPGGVAILIETITVNKNKLASELKHILSENYGRLSEVGGVKWLFSKKSVFKIDKKGVNRGQLEELAILSGADDFYDADDTFQIIAAADRHEDLKKTLQAHNISLASLSFEWPAANTVNLADNDRRKLNQLLAALRAHQDVQAVFTNSRPPSKP